MLTRSNVANGSRRGMSIVKPMISAIPAGCEYPKVKPSAKRERRTVHSLSSEEINTIPVSGATSDTFPRSIKLRPRNRPEQIKERFSSRNFPSIPSASFASIVLHRVLEWGRKPAHNRLAASNSCNPNSRSVTFASPKSHAKDVMHVAKIIVSEMQTASGLGDKLRRHL